MRLTILTLTAAILAAAIFPHPASAQTGLLPRPVACWDMEQAGNTTGSIRLDSAGTNHLTDNNTVQTTAGLINSAALFTSANLEYLSIADNTDLSLLPSRPFSIYAIAYQPTTGTHDAIIARNTGTNRRDYSLWFDRVTVWSNATQLATFTFAPTAAQWHTFLVSIIPGRVSVSIDAATPLTATLSAPVTDSTAETHIGRSQDAGQYLDGTIDTVAIFHADLITDGWATWLHNAGAGRSCAELLSAAGDRTTSPTSYDIQLPSGNYGTVTASLTAGDVAVSLLLGLLVLLTVFRINRELARAGRAR